MAVLVPNERVRKFEEDAKKGNRSRATMLVPQRVDEIWRHKCETMEKRLFAALEAHEEDLRVALRVLGVKFKENAKLEELRSKLGESLAKEQAKRKDGEQQESPEEGS